MKPVYPDPKSCLLGLYSETYKYSKNERTLMDLSLQITRRKQLAKQMLSMYRWKKRNYLREGKGYKGWFIISFLCVSFVITDLT